MSVTPELRCEVYIKTGQFDRVIKEDLVNFVTEDLFKLVVDADHGALAEKVILMLGDKSMCMTYDDHLHEMGYNVAKALAPHAQYLYAVSRSRIVFHKIPLNTVIKINRGVNSIHSEWHKIAPTCKMVVHENFTHIHNDITDIVTLFPPGYTKSDYADDVAEYDHIPHDFYDREFTKLVYGIQLERETMDEKDAPNVKEILGEDGLLRLAAGYAGKVPQAILDAMK